MPIWKIRFKTFPRENTLQNIFIVFDSKNGLKNIRSENHTPFSKHAFGSASIDFLHKRTKFSTYAYSSCDPVNVVVRVGSYTTTIALAITTPIYQWILLS
jgi:hypothetical protein